ncbi:uncharacterized protein LOC144453062 [Glandiceps talaboti]
MDQVYEEQLSENKNSAIGRSEEMRAFTSTQPLLNLCQLGFGALFFIMGILAIVMECELSYLGMPLYGGIFACLAGFIGMKAHKHKTTEKIMAALVFSFMSALFCGIAVVIVMAVAIDTEDNYGCWDRNTDQINQECRHTMHKRRSIDGFILMVAIFETFIAFFNGILYSCNLHVGDGTKGRKRLSVCEAMCSLRDCFKSSACCQPTQVYVVLSQSESSSMQIPVITMPADKNNSTVAMVPVNFQEMYQLSGKKLSTEPRSTMMYSQNEDVEMTGSESIPLIN